MLNQSDGACLFYKKYLILTESQGFFEKTQNKFAAHCCLSTVLLSRRLGPGLISSFTVESWFHQEEGFVRAEGFCSQIEHCYQ